MNVKLLDLQAQYCTIRDEVRQVIEEICDAQAFILGPVVERFEKNLAAYCQTRHAIGMSSGSDALLCALMAMELRPGDEVICPAFTFFATAGSIVRGGGKPVFADIDPVTFNIDPADVRRKLSARTRVVLPVHLFGQMADMEALNRIAAERDLRIIEDACQSIGARRNGVTACTAGLAGCLSFFPSKNLGGFGDGGAICTSDDGFAERCRMLRNHGMNRQYYYRFVGGNFRLDALQAGVLDVKLRYLPGWHEGRRRVAAKYDALFRGSAVGPPAIDPANWGIYHQYVVRLPADRRDRVLQHLHASGIGAAVYYPYPLHLQECFAHLGGKTGDLPHTEQACREVLALPVFPELTDEQINMVATTVLGALND